MGCNTSKENVQGAADEAKEDANNGNIPKQAESIKGKVNILRVETKSRILHPTGKNGDAAGDKQVDDATAKVQKRASDEKLNSEGGDITVTAGQQEPPDSDQTVGRNQEGVHCEKKETTELKEDQASTNIMSKCEQAVPLIKMVEEADSSPDSENKVDSTQDAHGYDMTDPNLHSAATKIQTHFRRSQDRQKAKAIQTEKTQ